MKQLMKLNLLVRTLTHFKIPLLAFCRPKILSIAPSAKVKIPLNWMTKNHYRTMYFGALCMGAELCVATPLLAKISFEKKKVNFLFKDFKVDFVRRADDNVIFEFKDLEGINDLIKECESTNTRVSKKFQGVGYSESHPENIFINFEITLSIK